MARPTDYSEEYIDKVDEYLALHTDEEVEKEVKGDFVKYGVKVQLPTIKGFARFIGVNESTIYEWDKKYPEFSKSLDDIKTEQHDRLINNGLSGDYNPTIAKLILSSNHGMSEKQMIDHTTAGESMNTDASKVALIADEVANKLKDENVK